MVEAEGEGTKGMVTAESDDSGGHGKAMTTKVSH